MFLKDIASGEPPNFPDHLIRLDPEDSRLNGKTGQPCVSEIREPPEHPLFTQPPLFDFDPGDATGTQEIEV